MTGRIHSIESFGTVDGPGIRMVIFLQGCPMRCLYCHNPDTWKPGGGTEMTVEAILQQYESGRHFYKNGGITVSGGEALMQIGFVTELFTEAKRRGIHTCLDTSGITFRPDQKEAVAKMDRLMEVTDLVLLDIKHIDPEEHAKLCGQENARVLAYARYLDQKHIPVWIRHVVVPGLTDRKDDLYQLGCFIGTLHNVKALEVLPYHDLGKMKYEKLGMEYSLKNARPLSKKEATEARKIILQGFRDKQVEADNVSWKETSQHP
jgi:pyruvate formate lyase activating enzyme